MFLKCTNPRFYSFPQQNELLVRTSDEIFIINRKKTQTNLNLKKKKSNNPEYSNCPDLPKSTPDQA